MEIIKNILLSVFAYGATSVLAALMLAAPSKSKLNPKIEEMLQYIVFYSVIVFELYIIWK